MLSVTEAMKRDSVGNPYTCNVGPQELSVWLNGNEGGWCLVALRWLMGQMSSLGGHAYRPGPGDLYPLCIKSN